jgi:hypothetical protein
MTADQFRAMAQHMGNTFGETASYQRSAGYSENDVAEWRALKDQKDAEFMAAPLTMPAHDCTFYTNDRCQCPICQPKIG